MGPDYFTQGVCVNIVGDHAVVVGASIGGLAAASVVAGRFRRVTVLDRDDLPEQAQDRRGVPQGMHAHALTIGGRLALEQMFPGLTEELVAGGAVPFDPGDDLLFFQMGALRARFFSGMLGISQSRAFLELAVRRRVAALPNVEIRDKTAVNGLIGASGRVTGVQLDNSETVEADLVVCASGRDGGRADRWLEQLGWPSPKTVSIKLDVGYTTRILRRRPGDLPEGGVLILAADTPPHGKRAGAVFPIEGDRWVVTLGGWHRDHAPVDSVGFAGFAARFPYICDLLARAEPISSLEARKFPTARRRYFERVRRVPAGYVALGDTICSFNPIYGQGMTVACQEALALGQTLDKAGAVSAAMARSYYRAVGKIIDTPWQTATGGDFMYPETSGPRPPAIDLINWLARQAMLAAHVSPEVHRVLIGIQHMVIPPSALLRPDTLTRSLLAARRSPAGTGAAGAFSAKRGSAVAAP
jgi:2-polyprenyl-6-methoxyphenol hydroxylase-like FAD-dependent oxidoreductase